jgi:hypothetical protein
MYPACAGDDSEPTLSSSVNPSVAALAICFKNFMYFSPRASTFDEGRGLKRNNHAIIHKWLDLLHFLLRASHSC